MNKNIRKKIRKKVRETKAGERNERGRINLVNKVLLPAKTSFMVSDQREVYLNIGKDQEMKK